MGHNIASDTWWVCKKEHAGQKGQCTADLMLQGGDGEQHASDAGCALSVAIAGLDRPHGEPRRSITAPANRSSLPQSPYLNGIPQGSARAVQRHIGQGICAQACTCIV